LDSSLAQLGGVPRYALFFRDLHPNRAFPLPVVEALHNRGLTPIVSLELEIWGGDGDHLQAIVDGQHDAWFRAWGEQAGAWGPPVIMRFGFEMNGDWFRWGQRPELFRQAWARAHRLVREAGGDNVQWMWCPNVLYGKLTPQTGLYPYWPGDDLVDLIGMDGYNFGDDHTDWHRWMSYDEVFSATIDALAPYGKPLVISEIGCVDDSRKAAWISDALAAIEQDRRIQAFVWFNYDKRREGEANWRINSDPQSLEVFQSWVNR
jgi:beta-mannanase